MLTCAQFCSVKLSRKLGSSRQTFVILLLCFTGPANLGLNKGL